MIMVLSDVRMCFLLIKSLWTCKTVVSETQVINSWLKQNAVKTRKTVYKNDKNEQCVCVFGVSVSFSNEFIAIVFQGEL